MKKEHASIAKITRPKVKGIFPRKRLFDLLDDSRNHPVTWVSGPAGCGKTSLVASYLDERKLPCIWYQVDEGDSDIASFFYYIGLAAKKAAPGRRKPLPLLTPEYLLGIPTFTLRFFENLCGRLNPPQPLFKKGGTKGGFVFVFDNCHRVAAETPFHEAILTGMCAIPDDLNVILISRNEPPPVYARLQANSQMSLIGWNELRFTPQESRAMMGFRAPGVRSKETIEHLHKITDGWAAGLVLISEGLKRGVELQSLEKSAPEEIIDYFGSELFSKTKKELRTFLMKTAFLPRMTTEMAQELTNLPNSGSFLATLTKNNYFIERRHHTEPVYQYHPLFRNFLIFRAKESFSTETILDLRHRAALLLEKSDQLEGAASLFSEDKNWEGLIQLIMKYAPSIMAQGRYQLLEAWLNSLPQDLIETNPWLLFWLGSSRFPFAPSQGQRCHEKAFELFHEGRNIEGTFLSWSSIVDDIAFTHNDLSRLDHWIHTLEGMMHDIKEFPSQEIGARVASGMVTALALRQPQHPDFHKWADRALSLTEAHQMINIRMWVLFNLFIHEALMGEFEKAALAQNLLSQLSESRDTSPFLKTMGKLADSIYYQFTGSHKKCMEAVAEGMELCRTTGIHIVVRPFLAHAISSSLNVNDSEMARQFLDRLASSLDSIPPSDDILDIRDRYIYHFLSVRNALAYGNLAEIPFHIGLALKYGNEMGVPAFIAMTHLMCALAMHRLGKNEEAMEELERGRLIAHEMKSKLLEFSSLLTQAYFAFDRGEEKSGLRLLRMAIVLGKDQRFLNTFFDDPSVTTTLCARALAAGIEVEYVQAMIRKRNLIPDQGSFQIDHWPWPLKIYTLGRFGIIKDGKPIRFSRKVQEKPHFMLKALIALGGRGVREEDISDILWPESDGDAAHHSFQMVLHRLRILLRQPEALSFREGRLTLDQRYCWVDAWAFERILGEADEKQGQGQMERAAALVQKAIRMYSGSFLSGEEEQPWVMFLRERLRSKFLRNVNWLGRHWEKARKWEKVLECYQRGLEVDNLAEELYRHLIVCHQELGQTAEALSVYNRCKRTLSSVLGIEPSPETEAVLKSIKSIKTLD